MEEGVEEGQSLPEWQPVRPPSAPDHPYYYPEMYKALFVNQEYARDFWGQLERDWQADEYHLTPQNVIIKFNTFKRELRPHYRVFKDPAEFFSLSRKELRLALNGSKTDRQLEYYRFRKEDFDRFSLFDVWADLMWEVDNHEGRKYTYMPQTPWRRSRSGVRWTAKHDQIAALLEEAMQMPNQENPVPVKFLSLYKEIAGDLS